MKNFRIAIDARSVISSSCNGIARHTDEIIKSLTKLKNSNFEFLLLTSSRCPYNEKDFPENFSFHPMNYEWSKFKGQWELTQKLAELKPDLFHSPSYMLPFYSSIPFIITIHDLIHVFMSKDYSVFHKFYYNVFLRYRIKKANAILTVSQSSKQDIINHFSVDPESVHVLYNGLGDEFLHPEQYINPEMLAKVRAEYSLPEKYILCVGNPKPHKNLAKIIEIWARENFEEDLVIISKPSPKYYQIAEQYSKGRRLHVPRHIDSSHMPALYNLASAFVFPSLYEGFGLPPLEALACGVPVVASDRSSVPEILGDTARYINPENEGEISRGIQEVLKRGSTVEDRIKRGILRTKNFTWEKTTSQVVELYKKAQSAHSN